MLVLRFSLGYGNHNHVCDTQAIAYLAKSGLGNVGIFHQIAIIFGVSRIKNCVSHSWLSHGKVGIVGVTSYCELHLSCWLGVVVLVLGEGCRVNGFSLIQQAGPRQTFPDSSV